MSLVFKKGEKRLIRILQWICSGEGIARDTIKSSSCQRSAIKVAVGMWEMQYKKIKIINTIGGNRDSLHWQQSFSIQLGGNGKKSDFSPVSNESWFTITTFTQYVALRKWLVHQWSHAAQNKAQMERGYLTGEISRKWQVIKKCPLLIVNKVAVLRMNARTVAFDWIEL